MLKRFIGGLLCRLNGRHVRGKLVTKDQTKKVFACPRCGRNTSYPVKAA